MHAAWRQGKDGEGAASLKKEIGVAIAQVRESRQATLIVVIFHPQLCDRFHPRLRRMGKLPKWWVSSVSEINSGLSVT
jgi:hypothetical protein